MATLRIPATSPGMYVPVPVYNLLERDADPTSDPVEMAFLLAQDASSADAEFHPATWLTIPAPDASTAELHVALCLVGTDGVVLAPGRWWPRVRFTDSPETPEVAAAGSFVVF
jgi:hypothetical protein